jgi:hypothetical protein
MPSFVHAGVLKGRNQMIDPDTYRKYAEQCRRLATMLHLEEDRRLLLEHAATWQKLAEEAERESDGKN